MAKMTCPSCKKRDFTVHEQWAGCGQCGVFYRRDYPGRVQAANPTWWSPTTTTAATGGARTYEFGKQISGGQS